MIVIAKQDDLKDLPIELQQSAWGQVTGESKLPISVGRPYEVFGLQKDSTGQFVLIVPEAQDLPIWMPKTLFDEASTSTPAHWTEDTYQQGEGGIAHVYAAKAYFGNEEDVEDATPQGRKAFSLMKKDNLSEQERKLFGELEQKYRELEHQSQKERNRKLAQERGYEVL